MPNRRYALVVWVVVLAGCSPGRGSPPPAPSVVTSQAPASDDPTAAPARRPSWVCLSHFTHVEDPLVRVEPSEADTYRFTRVTTRWGESGPESVADSGRASGRVSPDGLELTVADLAVTAQTAIAPGIVGGTMRKADGATMPTSCHEEPVLPDGSLWCLDGESEKGRYFAVTLSPRDGAFELSARYAWAGKEGALTERVTLLGDETRFDTPTGSGASLAGFMRIADGIYFGYAQVGDVSKIAMRCLVRGQLGGFARPVGAR